MVLEVAAAHHCLAASAFLAQATLSSQLSYPAVTSNACASRERVVEHSVMSTPFAPMHHHSNRHDLMSHRSTHIRLRTGASVRLDALKPKPGRSLCLSHAVLTLEHAFHTHVSMTWTRGDAESAPVLLIVMSDQRAHPERLQEYAVRMDIEQSFKASKMTNLAALTLITPASSTLTASNVFYWLLPSPRSGVMKWVSSFFLPVKPCAASSILLIPANSVSFSSVCAGSSAASPFCSIPCLIFTCICFLLILRFPQF